MGKLESSSRELILLHLRGLEIENEKGEAPFSITMNGIAKSIGEDRQKIKSVINDLLNEGLIKKSVKNVKGRKRERNVFSLTKKGKRKEKKIRNRIQEKAITVSTETSTEELKIKEIGKFFEREDPLVKILRNIEDDFILDISQEDEEREKFVGRDKELSKLRGLLEEVKDDGSKTVFISGEAGVGKTRLISEFKPYALEEKFDFLTGTCHSEIADPYLPLKEAFEKYIKKQNDHSTTYSHIAFIGTSNGRKVEDKKMFDAERKATFYETTKSIKNIANKTPLVVFLDDMHWTDKASADIMSYITSKTKDSPVLFICAYRPEDLSDENPLKENIHHMVSHTSDAYKIELDPLNLESTGKIIGAQLNTDNVPSSFVKSMHKKTNGNPLFVKECVKHMEEKGIIDVDEKIYPKNTETLEIPDIIHRVVKRRINRIEDESKRILDIGSVIGDVIDFDLLLEMSDINTFDLLDHVDLLVANNLWEEDPNEEKFYFHHSLIRETVYKEIRGVKKRILHKKIADIMEDIYSDELEERYSSLAHHFQKGKEYEKAFEYYTKKVDKSKEMYAHKDAIETYKNILDMIDKLPDSRDKRIEILEGMGDTCNTIGKYEGSREHFRKILDEDITPKTQIRIYRKISTSFLKQGEFDKAMDIVQKGLSIKDGKEKNVKEYCKLLSNKGWAVLRKGDHERTLGIFEDMIDIAENIEDKKLIAQSQHNLGTIYYYMENINKSSAELKEAINFWRQTDHKKGLSSSLNNLGLVKLSKRELDEANKYFKECLDVCEEIGDSKATAIALNNIGDIYREKGKLDEALDYFNDALDIDKRMADKEGTANCYSNIGITYYIKGDFKKALDYQTQSLDIYKDIGVKTRIAWVQRLIGDTQRDMDNIDKAFDRYEKAIELFKETGENIELSSTYNSMAEAYLKLSEISRAEDIAEKAIDLNKDIKTDQNQGESRKVLGRVYRKKGELDKAKVELDKADELFEDVLEQPKINYELGLVSKERGNLDKAKTLIKNSLDSFEIIGMKYWQNKCRKELEEI